MASRLVRVGAAAGLCALQLLGAIAAAAAPPLPKPSLSIQATPTQVVLGGSVSAQATLTGVNPTGTLRFALYGPQEPVCAGPAEFSTVLAVNGNGTYQSASYVPPVAGTYHWIVGYSGDASNGRQTTACNDPNAFVNVVDAAAPAITVTKTAAPLSRPEPGGSFTFTVSVANVGPGPVTLSSLTDDVYGNLSGQGSCTVGAVIQPGSSYTCSFAGSFTGTAGSTQTDTVTATAVDANGLQASASGSATVSITAAARLSINDVVVTEGDVGTRPAIFTVQLSQALSSTATVAFSTQPVTATANLDYQPTSGTLTFPPGTTTRTVTVAVIGDLVDEPDETFRVRLTNPVGAGLARATGTGTILDDERDGLFSCRATGLRLGSAETSVANPAGAPCADSLASAASPALSLGLVTVSGRLVEASTDQTPDALEPSPPTNADRGAARASATTATISVGLVTITVEAAESDASVQCQSGVPALSGSSRVARVTVNGVVVADPLTGPLQVPIPLVGTLILNEAVATATAVTYRAVRLDSILGSVVVAESSAGFVGNPCDE